MKKIQYYLFLIMCIIVFTSCNDKDEMGWILPGKKYHLKKIILTTPNTNNAKDVIFDFFPDASDILFQRNTVFTKDGMVTVRRVNYQTAVYPAEAYYDSYSQCWEYNFEYANSGFYTVTWSDQEYNDYHFKWAREEGGKMSINFSDIDPILNGQNPNASSIWTLLSKTYSVTKDTRKAGTLVAGSIILESDDGLVQLILVNE